MEGEIQQSQRRAGECPSARIPGRYRSALLLVALERGKMREKVGTEKGEWGGETETESEEGEREGARDGQEKG